MYTLTPALKVVVQGALVHIELSVVLARYSNGVASAHSALLMHNVLPSVIAGVSVIISEGEMPMFAFICSKQTA